MDKPGKKYMGELEKNRMSKLKSFIRLDFITVKPYFTVKNLIVFAVIALFITSMSGNFSSGVSLGMFIAINFISYPFVLSEKSNMDALYATLSADRYLVVLGRYFFTLALNLCAAAFFFSASAAGLLATSAIGNKTVIGDPAAAIPTAFALVVVIQSIQLPLYFKMGYAKAKFFSMVPYIAIMVGFVAVAAISNINRDSPMHIAYGLEKAFDYAPLLAFALIPLVILSYRISLAFYKKREF